MVTMGNTPDKLNSVDETLRYLYELRLFGTKLGLENPRRLAQLFDNPQHKLRFIHVAGTNGKGSVCSMLANIYREAGYRVGLFTSPHLIQFGERIQVDACPIPDQHLVALVNDIREALTTLPTNQHPTFFEVVVVLALLHFERERCEVVIWETGMGGRLDATNIVTPELSVITNVSLDHQKWLGATIEAIATEKSGIIKPGIPVVHGLGEGTARGVVERQAQECGSTCVAVPDETPLEADISVGLPGAHQRHNAALVWQAITLLAKRFPVSTQIRRKGLETVTWPGRLQSISVTGGTILLDGAHNEASVRTLCEHLQSHYSNHEIAFVLGVLEDKGIDSWLGNLVALADTFEIVPVASGRSLTPEEVANKLVALKPSVRVQIFTETALALEAALKSASLVVVCGSIYLVGEALGLLRDGRIEAIQQGLNDWGSAK